MRTMICLRESHWSMLKEGDASTLRWASCWFFWSLAANYCREVAEVMSEHVKQMLAAYPVHRAKNWKEKYAAIYLVISLQKTCAAGGRTGVVDMDILLTSVIVPELQAPDWKSEPMLKAAVLKLLNEFVDHIPKNTGLWLLQGVVRFVIHDSFVVRSYAASFIENLLISKDEVTVPGVNTVAMSQRYVASDINRLAPDIIWNLSTTLCFPDSPENPYLMSCLMRVLKIANISGPVVHDTVTCLVDILIRVVCNGPKYSNFSHYLFEALTAVIRQVDVQDTTLTHIFENRLLPVVRNIADTMISEFLPYTVQISAHYINLRTLPLVQTDEMLFNVLFSIACWDQPPCVPALLCLLRAFLTKFLDEHEQTKMLKLLLRRSVEFLKDISALCNIYYCWGCGMCLSNKRCPVWYLQLCLA